LSIATHLIVLWKSPAQAIMGSPLFSVGNVVRRIELG
jgi:hypothetical protein